MDLAYRRTYFVLSNPNLDNIKEIKYTVGKISIAMVFGRVTLGGNTFPGQKERIRIPVKCEYIY